MIKRFEQRWQSSLPLAPGLSGCLTWMSGAVLGVALCVSPALCQSQQPPRPPASDNARSAAPRSVAPAEQNPDQQPTGSISGTVVDQNGAGVGGAQVALARGDGPATQQAVSDEAGQFFFVNIAPGPFRLTITAPGFAPQAVSGALHPGEAYSAARIQLALAGVVTQVRVMPTVEMAEAQIKDQEKQRVLGVVPNFYVTYVPDAAPLDTKQKFELAWHSTIDPVTIGFVGATAGVQQAANQYPGYGQGAQGYGRRFGAAYADVAISTFLGGAILPSLFKQDPRFFYKGTGSKRSRVLYALETSVMCKGDNGHWQLDYSGIAGSLAAGGISNLYYPPQDRDDLAVTFESTAIGIGATAAENILQEFVVPKFTRKKGQRAVSPGGPSTP